ncbi:recombinase family protein [Faecalibacterium prausnitzii]|uniref:recombinase family protein n=2 Tax=Bacillota TaxID=1239 RepID=UPI0020798111|nr:recombinase family protein [Faecalibacterium prausnitzii]
MTAVIYARYSSDSQREASIEGQLRDCKDYAEKNGITVVGTYIDRAYSAKTDDRPDFQRMIKDSGKKIFDVVLVWKLDRFARNRYDAVNYKYQLEKNGVHLVSAMEPISQGPEGIMVESMLIGMAEYYSAELALKVARGERENALQCKYNGGMVPLGFTIGKEDRLYHIDPETAPIVQEIFRRYADGEPAEKIAASLNERGLRTRTGKPFVKNSFFQIFRNRRYIGEYRYKDIVTPGGIPAIVDQDLFDRVQQRFEQNRIAHGRPAKEDVSYLLTTKLFCGKCGTLMGGESGTSHMGNTYYYYKCGNAKRHGKAHCDLKAIRKEPLERFVVDTAIKVIFMEAIEQGILTPTTKQRLDELEARKEALNTSILEEELKKPVLTREWIRFWLEKFRKGDVGSTEHQRQIIDTFVNSVYVFDDRVVLNFNFTDDAKTVTREEVLGSSAVDNAPLVERNHRLRSVVLFVLLALCGMVWYTRLSSTTQNLYIKENIDETVFMFALFKCRKSDKGRN